MNRVIVLSGNRRETADFVKQLDLPVATRHVSNKDSIPMLPVDAVFVLPSFERRPDRHAIWSRVRHVIRRSHGIEPQYWTQVDPHTWAAPDEPDTVLPPDPNAVITDVQRAQLDGLAPEPTEGAAVIIEPATESEVRDEIAELVHEVVEGTLEETSDEPEVEETPEIAGENDGQNAPTLAADLELDKAEGWAADPQFEAGADADDLDEEMPDWMKS